MDDRQHCKFIQIVSHVPSGHAACARHWSIIGLKAPSRLSCAPYSNAKSLNRKGFFRKKLDTHG
ncbi:hypothetical protein BL240_21480 [Pseudomonas putida]|uniref:Uncharacterized protein n=1 Tax=Pseudomonas putida TaxID=303 RepID=A0A1L5PUM6_PSEPU|nr:hypothetical protein BL240_21480 [Pseudomonas putida]